MHTFLELCVHLRIHVYILGDVSHCARETRRIKALTLAGVTLINQYMVLSYLGQGSSGRVYLCMDIHDSRLYAVKVQYGRQRLRLRLSAVSWTKSSADYMTVSMIAAVQWQKAERAGWQRCNAGAGEGGAGGAAQPPQCQGRQCAVGPAQRDRRHARAAPPQHRHPARGVSSPKSTLYTPAFLTCT
jgi:hypothetical protein